jgi:hypothetical protein
MNTKREIFSAFRDQVSRKAITQDWDGYTHEEWAIVGKFARVTPLDSGKWDVWLANSADPVGGLGTGKRNNIVTGMADRLAPDRAPHDLTTAAAWGQWHLLDGEAWSRRFTTDEMLACLSLLGIRRKRVLSEESQAAGARRLAAARTPGAAL